jgi:hypothetical protein
MAQISLEDAIKDLRSQLEKAAIAGAGAAIRFVPKTVEVELNIAISKEAEGKASGGLWSIIDLSASGKYTNEQTHKVTLTLEPVGKNGEPTLIKSNETEK